MIAVIVDDLNIFSLVSDDEMQAAFQAVESVYDEVGWVAKAEKVEAPSLDDRKVSGSCGMDGL